MPAHPKRRHERGVPSIGKEIEDGRMENKFLEVRCGKVQAASQHVHFYHPGSARSRPGPFVGQARDRGFSGAIQLKLKCVIPDEFGIMDRPGGK